MPRSFPADRHTRRLAWVTMVGSLALTLAACQDVAAPVANDITVPSDAQPMSSQSANAIPDEYIVVFEEGTADPTGRASALTKAHGANLRQTYTTALQGFSAHMSAQAAEAMRNDPSGVTTVGER